MTSEQTLPRLEYVYLIQHKATGRFYAGSSYRKDCHPSKFWKEYFTSSRYVKQIIDDEGVNAFEVLEIIPRPLNDAHEYEAQLLRSVNAKLSDKWINRSNGDGKFGLAGQKNSDETRAKKSAMMLGNTRAKGITHTLENRLKWSKIRKGRTAPNKGIPHSSECKAKIAASSKGVPKALTTCPHCGKVGGSNVMHLWHFDKCKLIRLSHDLQAA
jgi:hypothetical protein